MITLSNTEIHHLINNMGTDARNIAVQESATQIGFTDQHGEEFSPETIALIYAEARSRKYHCYSCDKDLPIGEWTRDSAGVDLCEKCYDYAGWENEHSDYDHENHPNADCPICKEEAAA